MSENVPPPPGAACPRRALFGELTPARNADQGGCHLSAARASEQLPAAGAQPYPTPCDVGGRGPQAGFEGEPAHGGDPLEDQENRQGARAVAVAGAADAAQGPVPGVLREIKGEAAAARGIAIGAEDEIDSPLRRLRLVRAPYATAAHCPSAGPCTSMVDRYPAC